MACWPRTQTVCYDLKHSLFKVWPAPAVNNHRLRFDFQLLQAGSLPLCRTVQWTGFHYCRPNTQETFWVDQAAAAWSHSSAEQSMHCLPARGVKSLHSGPSLVVVSGTAGPDRRLHGLIFFLQPSVFSWPCYEVIFCWSAELLLSILLFPLLHLQAKYLWYWCYFSSRRKKHFNKKFINIKG